MKLRMLKTRTENTQNLTMGRRGALHLIEGDTRIIEWPYQVPGGSCATPEPEAPTAGGIEIKAEVQSKRFRDRLIGDERFTATVRAQDDSPAAILAALADVCAGIGELRTAGRPGDHVILQISLRS